MSSLAALDFLLGPFRGVDHLHESAWTAAEDAEATSEATVDLGGKVVIRRARDLRTDGVFETVEVFLADPSSDDVILYAFDSLGFPPDPPARGAWVNGGLEFHRASDRGESRTVFTPAGGAGDGFTWSKRFRTAADEPWQPVVDGTFG